MAAGTPRGRPLGCARGCYGAVTLEQRHLVPRRSRWATRRRGTPVTGGGTRPAGPGGGGESGQTLVLFALLAGVLVAMLALVIDVGVILGQRRFAQNGADAAALAAGRLLATLSSATDGNVYQEVRRYAGLDTSDVASAVPTGVNQHPGLLTRTSLVATLEYDNGDGWCVSPSTQTPPLPKPTPPRCNPARPASRSGQPYRLRVGVSATTDGFFARAIGFGDSTPADCLRPTGAPVRGITTCAQAAVTVTESSGGAEYALFGNEKACGGQRDGVAVLGSHNTVTGAVHSNSVVQWGSSSGNDLGLIAGGHHLVTVGCPHGLRGSPYGNQPETVEQTATQPMPLSHTVTDFPCDWYPGGAISRLGPGTWYANNVPSGAFKWDQAGPWWVGNYWEPKLSPGVYCARGDITYTPYNTRGPAGGTTSAVATFVATGQVRFTGGASNGRFKPHRNNVFTAAFGTGVDDPGSAALVEGSSMILEGVILAPNGQAQIKGSHNTITGALVAKFVSLTGSHLIIDGTGQGVLAAGSSSAGSPTIALTQ